MGIIPILFIVLICVNMKIFKQLCFENPFFYEQTLVLKGICAIEIVIGHLGGVLNDELILYPFRKAGVLIVGIFFFLSGYGLMHSYINKKDYLLHFWKKRFIVVLIPIVIVCVLAYGLFSIIYIRSDNYSISFIVAEVFKSINWYVWEICGFYVVFYSLFKVLNKEMAICLLFIITILFVIVCFLCGVINPWYGSTVCFPVGVMVANKQEGLIEICNSKRVVKTALLVVLLSASICMFFILSSSSFVGNVICRNISALSFTFLVLFFLQRLQIGNRLSSYLGKISFELFLIHPLFLMFFRSGFIFIENNIVYGVLVIALSVLFAIIINKISFLIKRMVKV